MPIVIEKIRNDKQKIITISLIVSNKFCEKIIPLFINNSKILYKTFTDFNRIIINWCIEYYKEYKQAPHSHIQDIFNSKKEFLKEEDVNLIKKFLLHLSDKFERDKNFNEGYVIDQAKLYIREVNLSILQEQINEARKNGELDRAENLVSTYNRIDLDTEKRQTTNILYDIEKAKKICSFELNKNINERLFKLPGDLGNKLNWIYREDFLFFAAYGKRGKSFYIRELANIACFEYGLNVIIFNLEMNDEKYVKNFYQNISNEIKDKNEKEIKIPYFEEDEDKYTIEYINFHKKGLNSKSIEKKLKIAQIETKGNIIVESFPSNTLSYYKIVNILDNYLLEGFVCDLLLIDYLDNLKSDFGGEFRHSIDDKWVNIRRLAQEKHIAIGTVTHTNNATEKGNVKPGRLSEDNRKYNHITHGIGINQLSNEKVRQYSRLNIIANRDEDFDQDQFFISLECRDIGKVMIDTKYKRNVILEDDEI